MPGAWSGWELAVRAVLGQQVSVAGARRTAEKLVELHGGFPAPEAIADGGELPGMPASRARALRALAGAVAGGLRLDPPLDLAGDPGGAAGAAGVRAVDGRVRRDARAARSRRVAGERPVAEAGGRRAGGGAVAAVAGVCGDGAVAGARPRIIRRHEGGPGNVNQH